MAKNKVAAKPKEAAKPKDTKAKDPGKKKKSKLDTSQLKQLLINKGERIGQGNSHISCGYSFTISKPGAPIDRQNCPIGDQVPR